MGTIRTIVLLSFFSLTRVYADASAVVLQQRNLTDTGNIARTLNPPAASADGIIYFNGTTILPQMTLLGTGLTYMGGTLAVSKTALALDNVANLTPANYPISNATQTALDAKLTIPGGTISQYVDGTGALQAFPSIPGAQVNSDWNAGSGVAQILNKPTLGSAASQNTSAFATAAQGSTADSALQPSGNGSSLTGLTQSQISGLVSDLAGKQSTITTGTTSQYFRGDLSLATFPTSLSSFTNGPGYVTTPGARTAISLTTTGTSGVSTYDNSTGILNVPNYANSGGTVTSITAGTGLSGGVITTTGTISVNTSQNISILSNLTTNGFVKTSGGNGTLLIDTNTYLTGNQTITLSGDVTGSGATAITTTLKNTGTAGTYTTVTTDAQGRVTAGTSSSFNNASARNVQTVAASGNGWQISATQNSYVNYPVSISTTATIGGPSSGTIVLEVAATNSSTAGDWTTIDTFTNNQTVTLALVLQSVQSLIVGVHGMVPAGYYVRVRSLTATGTVTYSTTTTGQEVKF